MVAPCNAQAVAWLDRWPDWPDHGLFLAGPKGCGKSHLLAAFAAAHPARIVAAEELRIAEVPAVLDGIALVLVDDLSPDCDQDALFHLFNLGRQQAVSLVFCAVRPAARLGLTLPDLSSRLRALPHVEIGPPDDDLLTVVIAKQFSDRQIAVAPEVLTYVAGRMERSFEAAGRLVDALDRAALSQGRAVTIPLARQVLGG